MHYLNYPKELIHTFNFIEKVLPGFRLLKATSTQIAVSLKNE